MKKTSKGKTSQDWSAFDAMTDQERHAAALSDPDAQPTPEGKPIQVRRRPLSWQVRRQLGLTQEQFAERYCIPIGTIRDWDQGRNELSAPAVALFKAIAANPDQVAKAQVAEIV